MIANVCHAALRLVHASGAHRLTARQLRHELRLAEHQLTGAGHYIAGLERDQRELCAELERVRGQRDGLNEDQEKARLRIEDLEESEREAAQLRDTNRALQARVANLTSIRPLVPAQPMVPPPTPTPTPSAVAVPLHRAPFAHSAAAEPS
ncbi:hypothetical protein ABT124_03305 [Streptomyces sp. NPDC001982]|uniref:hypothetical protein n=1 Tax=Streptomyces sp. NPDC001982 TaxID=3154405 RepID=UPI00331772F6